MYLPDKKNSLVERYRYKEENCREDSLHHRDDKTTMYDKLGEGGTSVVTETRINCAWTGVVQTA